MSTYRIEVSSDRDANPASNRPGLWLPAAGEASGWSLDSAKRAALQLLDDGEAAARVVSEETGEVVYAV